MANLREPLYFKDIDGKYGTAGTVYTLIPTGTATTPIVKTLTLAASSWSSGQYTISDTAITADAVVTLTTQAGVTADQYNALASAQIVGSTQSSGSIVLVALGTVPTIDLPITLIIQGVS